MQQGFGEQRLASAATAELGVGHSRSDLLEDDGLAWLQTVAVLRARQLEDVQVKSWRAVAPNTPGHVEPLFDRNASEGGEV